MHRPSIVGRPRAAALVLLTSSALAVALVGAAPAQAHSAPSGRPSPIHVVASGLDNPRHLVVDRKGDVYVAAAGRGAADPANAPCIDGVNPETGAPEQFCYGETGSIVKVHGRKVTTVVSGLPSVAGVTGDQAGGVSDLTVPRDGRAVGVANLGGNPDDRDDPAVQPGDAGASAGHLIRLDTRRDRWRIGADVSAFESANNPDAADPGSGIDSNPYGIAAGPHGSVVVADAGGNDLLRVDRRGRVSLLAVFHAQLVDAPPFLGLPPGTKIPMQAVPNSVVRGPDGAWYVSQLTGFPFPLGAAKVFRVVPGQAPTVYASGFTNIIDLDFDRRGRLLVLEIATRSILDPTSPGALWRVGKDGGKTLVADDLVQPGGVAVSGDRAYVTNRSTSAGSGELLSVRLPH